MPRAAAQVSPAAEAIVWEYTTTNVDTGSLQTKLMELGTAGWEEVAVTATDNKLDTGADGLAHVTLQRMEVTAKRTKKK